MTRSALFYMASSYLMLGLIIGYALANMDVIRMKTDVAMQEMVE